MKTYTIGKSISGFLQVLRSEGIHTTEVCSIIKSEEDAVLIATLLNQHEAAQEQKRLDDDFAKSIFGDTPESSQTDSGTEDEGDTNDAE